MTVGLLRMLSIISREIISGENLVELLEEKFNQGQFCKLNCYFITTPSDFRRGYFFVYIYQCSWFQMNIFDISGEYNRYIINENNYYLNIMYS